MACKSFLFLAQPGLAQAQAMTGQSLETSTSSPSLRVTTSLDLQQEWTDNAMAGAPRSQARPTPSFITLATPEVTVSGSGARLSGLLSYAPTISIYSNLARQNQVAQNLTANGTVALLPETLQIDVKGFADQQALYGGFGPVGTAPLSRQQLVQNYSFSVAPVLSHRFGGWGTAHFGVTDSSTTQIALADTLPGSMSNSQSLNTLQEYASFTSGENFARMTSRADISLSQSSGSGAEPDGWRNLASYQIGYALTHHTAALASVGLESIRYAIAGAGIYSVSDATWSVGAKLAPNPDSKIILLYGHHDGQDSATLNAHFAPTGRVTVDARYQDVVGTTTELLQNSIADAEFDPLGQSKDAQTGAALTPTDNFFGVMGGVYRSRDMSVSANWALDRDTVQAALVHQQRVPIGRQPISAGQTTGSYGSLTWSHELSAVLRASLYGQYGGDRTSAGAASSVGRLWVLSAGLTWQISQALAGSFQFSHTQQDYRLVLPSYAVNLVLIGVHKTF